MKGDLYGAMPWVDQGSWSKKAVKAVEAVEIGHVSKEGKNQRPWPTSRHELLPHVAGLWLPGWRYDSAGAPDLLESTLSSSSSSR